MKRIVAVSHRVAMRDGRDAPGGLAVAVRGMLSERGGLWFGWSGRVAAGRHGPGRLSRIGAVQCLTVDLTPDEHAAHYRSFCCDVLWPAFHGIGDVDWAAAPSGARSYLGVNRRLAGVLGRHLRADDLVWVHDFQLIPFAGLLRASGATQPLGFFLHVPFPEPRVLRRLEPHAQLLQSLLRYDALGFQTAADVTAFRDAVSREHGSAACRQDDAVEVDGRRIATAAIPVGIDVARVRREARGVGARARRRRASPAQAGLRRLIGVDRLDPTKGLVERLLAYEAYLEASATAGTVAARPQLLQVVTPPRASMRGLAPLRRAVARAARRINARQPGPRRVRLVAGRFRHDELMPLLAGAEVAIVSALRDGMNLVAKEFVAAQDPSDPGVLILSRGAGAAAEMDAALLVDPRDVDALGRTIDEALRMPRAERRRRHRALLATLRRGDLRAWHTRFVRLLERAHAHSASVDDDARRARLDAADPHEARRLERRNVARRHRGE